MKVCPACMEEVQEHKEICSHCGWNFPKSDVNSPKNQTDEPNINEKTDSQLDNQRNESDSQSINEKSEHKSSKSLNLGICIDRTGSSEQFRRDICSCCKQIFDEIESKFDKILCFMQSHGDLNHDEPIILHTDGDSPQQTLDDISRLSFEGGGNLHETHLDAIEHMLKILPPSQSHQNSPTALVVFCTSDSKPAKSGISVDELGAEVRRLGISLFLVCELTPTFHKLCKPARGFMLPISPSPSNEDIESISSHIFTILARI